VQSESVNPRTDNTMAKRKRTKGQKNLQNTTQKTKDQATQTLLKCRGCSGRVSSSCSTSGTNHVTQVTNL
jgi:hypothetical protein